MKRTNKAQSTTIQAVAGTAAASGVGYFQAFSQLDPITQYILLGTAAVSALFLIWIIRERLRRWANGDRQEITMPAVKDPKLARAGVSGYNKPKRTPKHPTKSHVVVAKEGSKTKTIRFGEQGAKTAGKPKAGESEAMKKKRASFKARHGKNIAKGKMSAAYWADKVKW